MDGPAAVARSLVVLRGAVGSVNEITKPSIAAVAAGRRRGDTVQVTCALRAGTPPRCTWTRRRRPACALVSGGTRLRALSVS
jgi:hypothetical protein